MTSTITINSTAATCSKTTPYPVLSLKSPHKKGPLGINKKSVRRNLFNTKCSSESIAFIEKLIQRNYQMYTSKYHFDFVNETPMEGCQFNSFSNEEVPSFYHSTIKTRSSSPTQHIENICPKPIKKQTKITSFTSIKRKNFSQISKQTNIFKAPFASRNFAMSC
uniref:CDI domain-containing protein n=1 Tax=Rhabditophanes sp. KR3021 TaxID=114890 RepID=A0AC35TX36_9BILA